jgi:spermidine synthase
MRLMQRGSEYTICVGTIELMNNRSNSSEVALASLTCARLKDRPKARVLIGGLGMGFTLRAALDALGPDARVVVAELVPAVVAWARGPLAHIFAGSLDEGLTRLENDRLYDEWGLKRARYALRPNGILAVWSGGPDRKFKARLRNMGFSVDEVRVHANGRKGRRHVLWLATHADARDNPWAAAGPRQAGRAS